MIAHDVQIDSEYEDDGLYSITFWVDEDPPRYITLARDDYEEPDCVYLEFQDQKYGFKSKNLTYTIDNSTIKIKIPKENKTWGNSSIIEIKIPNNKISAIQNTLVKIFDTN